MHKNWVRKEYDQSVTCLADDPQNLVTRSSMLRTFYRKQTIAYISTQAKMQGENFK
mgnify:CR=1 FL=1